MRRVKNRAILVMTLTIALLLLLSGCAESQEMTEAKESFGAEASRIAGQAVQLDEAISAGEELVLSGENLLKPELVPALETAVSEGKAAKIDIPEMPREINEINEETSRLKEVDYERYVDAIREATEEVRHSIDQYKLVDCPTESYVIQKLGTVPNVQDISAVTEDNDPNGQLGKAGGYTAAVYFSSDLVDVSELYSVGESVIERGTDGGGCIEVYASPEDAERRQEYLAAFDGSVLATGSHTVVGTVLVRTSNLLTASQQDALESAIVEALTALA